MGATRTPRSPEPLWRLLRAVLPEGSPARFESILPTDAGRSVADLRRWAVACSGGRDSVALLHASVHLAQGLVKQGLPAEVLALHVHHGLSSHADDWAAHVERLCLQWAAQGMPVRAVLARVQVDCKPGDSLESEARRLRHAALHDMAVAEGVAEIWLAHHQRDQAETFVLQALRGAGVKGLAAMPQAQIRAGVNWVRPWLQVPAEEVAAYVQRHGLPHIEDESNHDTRWSRNHLRHAVWPRLQAHFGGVDARLADAAAHVADVLPVLEAWAQSQLTAEGMAGTSWPVGGWCARPANERRLLLAAWYRQVSGRAMPASWVSRLAVEWPELDAKSKPWRDADLGLVLYRGQASWQGGDAAPVGGSVRARDLPEESGCVAPPGLVVEISVTGPGRYPLPGLGGHLRVSEVSADGVHALPGVTWQVRCREGGERWQAHAAGPARSLKKQWQAAAVPPWARQGPLVWQGGHLLWVPGLGVDARLRAKAGGVQWALAYEPGAA